PQALTHFNSPRHADIILRIPHRSRTHPVPPQDQEVDVFFVHTSYLSRSEVLAQNLIPSATNASPLPGAYLATLSLSPPAPRQIADALYHIYTGSIDPSTLEPDRLIGTLLNALYLRLPLVLDACRSRLHEALPVVAQKADFGPRSVPYQLLAELLKASRAAGGPLTARDRLEILLAWGKDVTDVDAAQLRQLVGSLMYGEELDVADMAVLAERWGPVFERAVPPSIALKAGLSRPAIGGPYQSRVASAFGPRMPTGSVGMMPPPQAAGFPGFLKKGDSQMSFVWED
ncbi:hypothetical protein HK097_005484, partial [Rhizophlyctis rosea]